MAASMTDARRVEDCPPHPHFPMRVEIGPRPRARQLVQLQGPRALPGKPARMPRLSDEDDEADADLTPLGDAGIDW
eukprot:8812415-Pyramimonas_sp.AAC.1